MRLAKLTLAERHFGDSSAWVSMRIGIANRWAPLLNMPPHHHLLIQPLMAELQTRMVGHASRRDGQP